MSNRRNPADMNYIIVVSRGKSDVSDQLSSSSDDPAVLSGFRNSRYR